MRFIKKEHIITTVFNKEVESIETIQIIFKNLHRYRIDFSIIFRKFFTSDYDYRNISYDKVRVSQLNEDNTIDILVFNQSTTTKINNLSFSEIVEVRATTIKNDIMAICDDITRWDILDI